MLADTDAGGGVQPLFMQARFGIEQFGLPDPELPRGLVRIDPRPDIRLITHPHHRPPDSRPCRHDPYSIRRSFGVQNREWTRKSTVLILAVIVVP